MECRLLCIAVLTSTNYLVVLKIDVKKKSPKKYHLQYSFSSLYFTPLLSHFVCGKKKELWLMHSYLTIRAAWF